VPRAPDSVAPVVFHGLEAADFDVFAVPDFAPRMAALRGSLRPRLLAMADLLRPTLEEVVGRPLFAHVAAHLRRRVHPPPETWAAFGPSPRGYKSFAHFAVGIRLDGIFLRLVLKEEAVQDRRFLAGLLGDDAQACLGALPADALVYSEPPMPGYPNPTPVAALRREGRLELPGLRRSRDSQWAVGCDVPRGDPRLLRADSLRDLTAHTLSELVPLWQMLPSWWNPGLWSPGPTASDAAAQPARP